MKISTLDILKMLPFDESFKQHILTNWDKFSEDQRSNLMETIWDTYDDIYQIRLNTNTEIAMRQIAEGKETMDKGLAQRIREKTDKEFEEQFQKTVPVADLAEAREKLQEIMDTTPANNNPSPVEENKDTPQQN